MQNKLYDLMTVKTYRQKSCFTIFFTQDEKHSPEVTLRWVQAEALFSDKAKDVDHVYSCSAAGQDFTNFFCPVNKGVCLVIKFSEAKFFIIKYLCVLHSMI